MIPQIYTARVKRFIKRVKILILSRVNGIFTLYIFVFVDQEYKYMHAPWIVYQTYLFNFIKDICSPMLF